MLCKNATLEATGRIIIAATQTNIDCKITICIVIIKINLRAITLICQFNNVSVCICYRFTLYYWQISFRIKPEMGIVHVIRFCSELISILNQEDSSTNYAVVLNRRIRHSQTLGVIVEWV